MSNWNISLGEHLPRVTVTRDHVLRALEGTEADPMLDLRHLRGPEVTLHAAAIVAVVESFHLLYEGTGLAQFNLVEEAMGADYLADHARASYGFDDGSGEVAAPSRPFEEAMARRLAAVERRVGADSGR